MKLKLIISWLLRIVAAVILLQTLYFKFTAHPESVAIFSKLGVEPWGRIGTGVMELITGILLLVPATAFIGGILGMGLMSGAIGAHVFVIGIESAGDGGQLFAYAIIVFVCCFLIAIMHRRQATALAHKLKLK
ncbi:MAG: DoxX family protein [Taibaiella sp.]|nr:DoxX family protein [Taibaiella sp.]